MSFFISLTKLDFYAIHGFDSSWPAQYLAHSLSHLACLNYKTEAIINISQGLVGDGEATVVNQCIVNHMAQGGAKGWPLFA